MANSIQLSPFSCQDTCTVIFSDAASNNGSELLTYRLVCKLWNAHANYLIEMNWGNLRQDPPKGAINVTDLMDKIVAEIPTNNPAIYKFARLMTEFFNNGSPIKDKSPMLVTIDAFQGLQNEYDVALQTIWKVLLYNECEELGIMDGVLDNNASMPALDADAGEIRKFLNGGQSSLRRILFVSGIVFENIELALIPFEFKLFKNLWSLELEKNQLKNIVPLKSFTKLTELNLNSNEIRDVSSIKFLVNLRYLNLGANKIKSGLAHLISLTELHTLDLNSNGLKSIAFFARVGDFSPFVKLRELSLHGNRLDNSSLVYIKDLVNLEKLDLSVNCLTDISILERARNEGQLAKLKEADFCYNYLQDIPFSLWDSYGPNSFKDQIKDGAPNIFCSDGVENPFLPPDDGQGSFPLGPSGKRTYEDAFNKKQ